MGKITGEMKPENSHAIEEMQREIRTTEAEITETLHSIEAKLAPSHLKQEVKGRLLRGTAALVVKVGYAIKNKPAQAAAVGAGALWMMVRKRKRHAASRELEEEMRAYERLAHERHGHKKHAHKRHAEVPVAAVAAAALKAMPKEAKRHPAKTAKRIVTFGRMAFAFVSTVGAVLLRGKRARHELDRARFRDYTHHHVGGY